MIPIVSRIACITAAAFALALHAPAQIVETKLLAPDGGQQDNLGWSVASTPGWAFCSAPGDDDVLNASGAIYAFQDTGSGWTFAQKLKAEVPALEVRLGEALAASGSWLVAGAQLDAPTGTAYCGSAEVFHLEGGVWVHTQKLIPSDSESTYHVAASVDVCGDWMVLGAPDEFAGAGAVYLFQRSGTTWTEVTKFRAPDLELYAHFAFDVALDGDTLAVGSPWSDLGTPNSNQGSVYVFGRVGSTWQFQQKLVASDPHQNDDFGHSVALQGDRIAVGANFHDHASTNDGAIYVFERQGGVWSQTAELTAVDPDLGAALGWSVDLDGDLAVGCASTDDDHGTASGSAYVFRRNANGTWLQIAKAIAPDSLPHAQLGSDARLLGERVLVGSLQDDWACPSLPFACNAGSAYVFELAPQAVQYGSCPTQGPCGNHDAFGGCLCSSGAGGELAAAGSASVSTDDLRFEARWLPQNKLGLFFMGGMPTSMPFGDGQLCVTSGGAGVWRFNPAQSSGAPGVLTLGPVVGLSNSLPPGGHIQPGQIWHFQAWFRDPAGPCGQGSNMTNAVRVMFEL